MESLSRQSPGERSQTIRSMSQIAAKQFVRTFAAQADRCLGLAQLGKEPDRKRSSVRRRFIRVIRKRFNRTSQVDLRIQIQFLVVGLIALRNLANICGFVETAPLE